MARSAFILLADGVKGYESFTLPLADEGYSVDDSGYLIVNAVDGSATFPPEAWRGVIVSVVEGGES